MLMAEYHAGHLSYTSLPFLAAFDIQSQSLPEEFIVTPDSPVCGLLVIDDIVVVAIL